MTDQDDMTSHSFFTKLSHLLALLFLIASRLGMTQIPVFVPEWIFYFGLPQLTFWK